MNRSLTIPANELRTLAFAALLFALATLLVGLAAGLFAFWKAGSFGLLVAVACVALCAISALSALFVTAWSTQGDGVWTAGMSAVLIRTGIPMVAAVAVTLMGGRSLMRDWGVMFVCIYLWFLVVETCLSVAIVSGSSQAKTTSANQVKD